MTRKLNSIRWMIAVACCVGVADLASAQAIPGQGQNRASGFAQVQASASGIVSGSTGPKDNSYPSYPSAGTQSQQRMATNVSGSRRASFMKNGKRVTVSETDSGVMVSVDGKVVRAKDAVELKRKSPQAYRLFQEGLRNTIVSARAGGSVRAGGGAGSGASARAGGSARGGGSPGAGGLAGSGNGPLGMQNPFHSSSSQNRSVSVIENGKKISITETKKGITVSINGKRVRAKNADQLKAKFPEAFQMYERHMGGADQRMMNPPDAMSLMRGQLSQLRDQNAENRQLREMLERMMESIAP
ncbi:MAG: hypothetical protein AAFX06_26420 [Planctomycetota bacterium]